MLQTLQNLNQHAYKEVLQRLLRSLSKERRELRQDNSWLFHYDNAPAHNIVVK